MHGIRNISPSLGVLDLSVVATVCTCLYYTSDSCLVCCLLLDPQPGEAEEGDILQLYFAAPYQDQNLEK